MTFVTFGGGQLTSEAAWPRTALRSTASEAVVMTRAGAANQSAGEGHMTSSVHMIVMLLLLLDHRTTAVVV